MNVLKKIGEGWIGVDVKGLKISGGRIGAYIKRPKILEDVIYVNIKGPKISSRGIGDMKELKIIGGVIIFQNETFHFFIILLFLINYF